LQADSTVGNSIELVVGPNYHGARKVTVAAPRSSTPAGQPRTAADNPCT
jgi:hypothetical protein